jgi:hypothetical protein
MTDKYKKTLKLYDVIVNLLLISAKRVTAVSVIYFEFFLVTAIKSLVILC